MAQKTVRDTFHVAGERVFTPRYFYFQHFLFSAKGYTMLSTMNFCQSYTQKEYKALARDARIKLFNLQQQCMAQKVPVIIYVDGVSGTGKGSFVNLLSEWCDVKHLKNYSFWFSFDEERLRPEAWKYWMKIPKAGEFAVFIAGMYDEPMRKLAAKEITETEFNEIMHDRVEFERTLAQSGYVIVKLWFHITADEHKKRMKARKKLNNKGEIGFSTYDEQSNENFENLNSVVGKMLPLTDKHFAPWYIIDAYDEKFRNIKAVEAISKCIENALDVKKTVVEEFPSMPDNMEALSGISVLDQVDLSLSVPKDEYEKELEKLQKDIYKLTYKAYELGISSTIVFEGYDASGKGGAIRRLTQSIDSRITQVIPISAPGSEEAAHHYLWRFWRHVPRAGFVTIYDRSWYGRVLVERVEGFASQWECKRAFSEINAFENELINKKNILIKFWLHISLDEQLRRFKEREAIEWKRHKITEEDWRNREKADQYKIAANEMFLRTNTVQAPWFIIPGENKLYARLEVLRTYKHVLEERIKEMKKGKKK